MGERNLIDWDSIGDDVIAQYQSGKTANEIAESYGLSEGSIYNFLSKSGIHKKSEEVRDAHRESAANRSYDDQSCSICSKTFTPASGNQKYCKTCIPSLGARKRYESYKISAPEWDRLLAKQNGICKLCPSPATVVDHNHKSGEPRGLLCTPCNTALGRMELEGWNSKAMEYLSSNMAFSVRDYWLIWKLIESLRARNVPFEGREGEFAGDFNQIRDKCLDRAFDYNPTKDS